MTSAIQFAGDQLRLPFNRFGPQEYGLFLKAKRLPESRTLFDPLTETYTIEAPARFAPMLGVELPKACAQDLPFASYLFDDQLAICKMALDAKRFAVWSDCGSGKTPLALEWSRHVIHRTGGRVLIVTINEICNQWLDEAKKFYGDSLPVHRIRSRQEMRDWCKHGGAGAQIAITNYEKWNPESLDQQIVSEAKHLAGIVLDENRIKTGGGKQKWALIHSCKGIEYKLSLTATPAPNDTMEFASQASFLEKMRNQSDIIWTYFVRDPKTHRWTVKRHARKAFFEFMSSWSIYVRNPKRYGWRLGMEEVPEPEIFVHDILSTEAQRAQLLTLAAQEAGGQGLLFYDKDTNAIQRAKLSQVAKGFVYLKDQPVQLPTDVYANRRAALRRLKEVRREIACLTMLRRLCPRADSPHGRSLIIRSHREIKRIDSLKPAFVADLIRSEAAAGLQVLVWTIFDAESNILAEELTGTAGAPSFDLLTGKTKDADRIAMLERFRTGASRILISRASMLGYGMNFQNCGSMIFSGWSDSFETYYQALRRAYRYGQKKRLRVHIPCIKDLEGDQLENIFRKESAHNAAIDEMEANYITATAALRGAA